MGNQNAKIFYKVQFDVEGKETNKDKMWNQMPQNDFVAFGNDSQRIKLIS